METKRASDGYRWLWLSPFLTVPTLLFILFNNPGVDLICGGSYRNCDYQTSFLVTAVIAIVGAGLWHLVLLRPALDKQSAFVRAHGWQALILAGIRTAIPLAVVILSDGDEFSMLFTIPLLIVVWLAGTAWGQGQAKRGDCSLLRWQGDTKTLRAVREETVKKAGKSRPDPDKLVHIIRFNPDPDERRRALEVLDKLGLVEYPEAASDNARAVGQPAASATRQVPSSPALAEPATRETGEGQQLHPAAPPPAELQDSTNGGADLGPRPTPPAPSALGSNMGRNLALVAVGVVVLGALWMGMARANAIRGSSATSTPWPTSTLPPETATQQAREAQAEAHYQEGNDFYADGQFEAAADAHRLAIDLDENHARAMNNLAWTLAYDLNRNHEEALIWAQRSVELDPRANHLDTLALVYYKLGRFSEALDYYNRAIALDADEVGFYRRRGDTYLELGQKQQAINDYLIFVSRAPEGPERSEVEELIQSIQNQ